MFRWRESQRELTLRMPEIEVPDPPSELKPPNYQRLMALRGIDRLSTEQALVRIGSDVVERFVLIGVCEASPPRMP